MNNNPLKLYVFCCLSSLDPDELMVGCRQFREELKIVPLPCSGKIDILYLTKAFETGADGVAVVTCKIGECRYLEGNLRARKRLEVIENLLEEIGLDKGRTEFIQLDDAGTKTVVEKLGAFRSKLKALPALVREESVTVSAPGK